MIENTKLTRLYLLIIFLCLFAPIASDSYRNMRRSEARLGSNMPNNQLEEDMFFYMQPTADLARLQAY